MTLKKEYSFRDPIIKSVVDKFVSRSDVGFKKYGVTLEDDDGDINVWLSHIQEELMDAVNYIEKLKNVLTDELTEKMLEEYNHETRMMYPGDAKVTVNK